jgi:predicted dehydrogenase
MARRVKVALVGCGSLSQRGILPHLSLEDARARAELVAVCDVDAGRAAESAQRFDVPSWYAEYDGMLRESDAEAVLLATPIPSHYPQARAAIDAGKHVYVQKTMTTSLAEADALVEAAREKGVRLVASPGQMLSPAYRHIRELLLDGALGRLYWALASTAWVGHEYEPFRAGEGELVDPSWYYRAGGGPLYDMGVYSLHALTGVLGPACRVLGLSGIGLPVRSWQGRQIDVEMDDNTVLLLDFGNSAFAVVGSHFCSQGSALPWGFLGFYGSEAALEVSELEWDTAAPARAELQAGHNGDATSVEVPLLVPTLGAGHGALPETHVWADISDFLDCVLEGRESVASGEHARHVIEIVEKGYVAARSGQAQELLTTF